MKNYSGVRYGSLVVLERDLSRESRYWICLCDCGEKVSRIPTFLAHQKINACPRCRTGSGSHAWKGYKGLPQDIYNTIRHSAEARGLELNVSIECLWKLYEDQNKLCAFTGLPISFNETYRNKKSKTASLDRIDSSKGYIVGNLQWVHRDVNKLKKNFSDIRFIELCKLVASKP